MTNKLIVTALLGLMLVLGLASMGGDSGIVDEVAHIPAGYSYLKFGDYRLNPEHPPLLKDLAALPLLLMDLKFPSDQPAWTTDANGQWETGWHFIYHLGNDADQILFWSRLPILLLAVFFGYVLYRFCRRYFGEGVTLLTLFFFALSPNLLAHSRFVTTDLGIAAFMFFAFYGLFLYFEKPNWKNLWLLTILFALVLLTKFSAIILYPFFGLLAVIAVATWKKPATWQRRFKLYIGGLLFVFVVSMLLVWIVYIPHTWNMPLDVQDRLITASLPWGFGKKLAAVFVQINDLPFMKSIVQYLLGTAMVLNRVQGGNTTYLLGEVTNQSFTAYFPVTYVLKTPVPILFLAAVTLLLGLWRYFKNAPFRLWRKFKAYAQNNFIELSFILFIIFYGYISITGNLNLGIRHLFPIIPMIFLLVAKEAVDLIKEAKSSGTKLAYQLALVLLLTWYALSNFLIYPSYAAYLNEVAGGPGEADRYFTDSNVDWGQDLKRLKRFVDENNIQKIAVDYFGGGEPKYYFCERIPPAYDCAASPYVEWHAENGRWSGEWIAVSETFLMNDLWWAAQRGDEGYAWLRAQEPVAKIGYSIYVYNLSLTPSPLPVRQGRGGGGEGEGGVRGN